MAQNFTPAHKTPIEETPESHTNPYILPLRNHFVSLGVPVIELKSG